MEKPAFLIGSLGGGYLMEQLTSSNQPFKVIEQFQKMAGLRQSEVSHCIPLLDLHQIPRSEVYVSLVNHLRDQLVGRIDSLDKDKLATMLEQSFSYIGFEEVKAVPFAILKKMKEVPARYLRQLSANKGLYQDCPIEVKRQIWQINEGLFKEELLPHLRAYMVDLDLASPANEMCVDNSFPPPPPSKRRKQDKGIQNILGCIGDSVKLYNFLVHYLRNLFVETRNYRFCTLRADILMALHDDGVSDIVDLDPCHKFAWCLDACVRDNTIDLRRIREMQSFFDSVPEGSSTLGDLAMIVANPYTSNTLLRNIFHTMIEVVNREGIPKEDEVLWYTTQLYSLGLDAVDILKKQEFSFVKPQKDIFQVFYPTLASMILDDLSRAANETTARELEPNLNKFCDSSLLARRVSFYYLLTRVQSKDYIFVEQLLETLGEPSYNLASEESFIQSLVTELIAAKNQLLRVGVFENFLMKYKESSVFAHKQLVRYLTEAHSGIQSKDLASYVEKLVPKDCDEMVREQVVPVYELFLSRVGGRITDQNAPSLFQWLQKYQPMLEEEGTPPPNEEYQESKQGEAYGSPNYETTSPQEEVGEQPTEGHGSPVYEATGSEEASYPEQDVEAQGSPNYEANPEDSSDQQMGAKSSPTYEANPSDGPYGTYASFTGPTEDEEEPQEGQEPQEDQVPQENQVPDSEGTTEPEAEQV